jgi:ABC-2 type transport system permease protein
MDRIFGHRVPGNSGLLAFLKALPELLMRDLDVMMSGLGPAGAGNRKTLPSSSGNPVSLLPAPSTPGLAMHEASTAGAGASTSITPASNTSASLTPAPSAPASTAPASSSPASLDPGSGIFLKAFMGLFLRDLRVLTREFLPFLLRVGMQPLLFLFVFTFILPRMGGANPMAAGGGVDFGTIILPGLMAVAIMFSGIAAVALPLSSEFGITREIDDRVMCPLPLWAVALEKVCFSAMQSIIAALLVIPMAYYIPAVPVRAHVANWFLLALVLVLASLLAGSLGLVIGSTVNPKQIGLVFSILVVPITFLGCVYYTWTGLFKNIRWLAVAVLFNPIVYMSEGLRASVTPIIPHMPWWAILVALVFFTAALGRWGLRGFLGRVLS